MTNVISKVIHNGTEYEFNGVNGGVTSVNGNTGAVTVNDVKVSASAPSSPSEGMAWYDTTNDQLKVYDGSNWNVTGKEYHAGEGIEIGNVSDYSAMQGPAPDGFHVPSKDEWVALCGILTSTFSMDANATTVGTYLKMPRAGYRYSSSSNVGSAGSNGYYLSSTVYTNDRAYYLFFNSSSFNCNSGGYRADGYPVRCFKDTPVIPDSSWTTLYQGSGNAGVFRNSSLGLISVSGDGTTWYTIQDKNLGATTVYNEGDTLSDANCGYFYQWGNNYGFAHSGTVTTSATKVDASSYGPGNYYNSSTFITVSASPYDWSSVQNDNLWGGVTGVVTLDNAITNTGVTSVNGQTGDVIIPLFVPGNSGTTGQVLTKTSSGYNWQDVSGGDVIVSSQPNNILTSGMKIWAGTESDYSNLGTYDTNTVYLTIPDGSVQAIDNNENLPDDSD